MRMSKIKLSYSFKELSKPMGWAILLSFLYNIAYIYGSAYLGASLALYFLIVLLSLISAVGLYWICLQAWQDHPKLDKDALLPIVVYQGILITLTMGVLSPLHTVIANLDLWYLTLPYQIVCALLIVLAQPLELCMFTSLAQGKTSFRQIKTDMKTKLKNSFKPIWNRYALLLLMVIFLDSLVGAPLSMASGLDAFAILSGLVFYANPMFSWMFALTMAAGFGMTSSIIAYLVLLFGIGMVYLIVECNYLFMIKKNWITDGIKKAKAHKKKK